MRQGKFSFNPTTSPMRDTYGEHWGNGIGCRKSARGSVRGVPSNGRPYCDNFRLTRGVPVRLSIMSVIYFTALFS